MLVLSLGLAEIATDLGKTVFLRNHTREVNLGSAMRTNSLDVASEIRRKRGASTVGRIGKAGNVDSRIQRLIPTNLTNKGFGAGINVGIIAGDASARQFTSVSIGFITVSAKSSLQSIGVRAINVIEDCNGHKLLSFCIR